MAREKNAVGVAVMSDADICVGEFDETLDFVGMRTAASVVDVHSVRLVVCNRDVGPELAQNARRRLVSGAVRDVDCDAQFLERHFSRKTRLCEFDIAAKRVINSRGASNFTGRRPDVVDLTGKNELLDLFFDLVIKFVTVVPEKFDAVVFVRIVRSRKNNAGVSAQRSGNVCHARRWQRTDDKNIDAK